MSFSRQIRGAWLSVTARYGGTTAEDLTTFTVCLAALSLDKSDLSPVGPPANTAVLSVGVEPDDPSQTAVLSWCVDPERVCVYENGTTVSSPIQRAPAAMPAQLSVTALQGLSTGPCEIVFSLGYLCASDKAGAGVRYWTPPPDATNRDVLFEGVPVTNMTIYNAFTPACNDLADYGYSARMHGDLDTMWAYAWSDAAQSGGYGFLNYTSDLTWNRQLERTDVLTTGVYAPTAQYQDVLQGLEAVDDGGAVTEKTATAKIFDVTIEPPLPFVAVNTTHTLGAMVRPPLGGPDGQLYIWTRGTNPDCLRFVVGGQEYDDITTSGETMASVTVVTKAPGLASLTIEYRSPYDDLDRRITYTTSTQIGVVLVEVTNIKFNHDPASTANDAINIRQDYSTPYDITNGEWIKGGANLPACYITSKTVTIKARFSVNLTTVTSADVSADSTDHHGTLGDVSKTQVSFTAGVSDWITMPVSGLTAACVKKTSDTWQWKAGNFNGLGTNEIDANISGQHNLFVVLGEPSSPWSNTYGSACNAWRTVLDRSCDWADSATNEAGAVEMITTGGYERFGKSYDGSQSHSVGNNCHLTAMLSSSVVDCRDMAAVVQLFTGALGGGSIQMKRIQGGFDYKPILAIGKPSWQDGYWNFHQVGWYGNAAYDACAKLKESAPYIPVNDDLDGNYKTNLFDSGTWTPQSPHTITSFD